MPIRVLTDEMSTYTPTSEEASAKIQISCYGAEDTLHLTVTDDRLTVRADVDNTQPKRVRDKIDAYREELHSKLTSIEESRELLGLDEGRKATLSGLIEHACLTHLICKQVKLGEGLLVRPPDPYIEFARSFGSLYVGKVVAFGEIVQPLIP